MIPGTEKQTEILSTFSNYKQYEMSHVLRLEPASQPHNLRAEPEKLERVTY